MKKTVRFISTVLAFVLTAALFTAFVAIPSSAAMVDYVDNSEAKAVTATADGVDVELTWESGFISTKTASLYKVNEYETIFHSQIVCVEKAGTEITWTDSTKSHFLTDGGYNLSSWTKGDDGYWKGNPEGANFKGNAGVENTNNIEHVNDDGTVTYKYVTSKDGECLKFAISHKSDGGASAGFPTVNFKLTGARGTLDTMNILKNDTRDALNVSATKEGIELDIEWNWGYFSTGTADDKSGSAQYAVVQNYAAIFSSQVICVEKAGTEIIWKDTTTSHYLTAGGYAVSSWMKNTDGVWVPDESGAFYAAAGGDGTNEIQTPQADGSVVYRYVTTKDNECIRLALSQRLDDPLGESIPNVSFRLIADETPENPDTSDSYIGVAIAAAFVSAFGIAFIVSRKVRV